MKNMTAKTELPLLKFFEEHGITLKDLVDTALEFYVPHPGVENQRKSH